MKKESSPTIKIYFFRKAILLALVSLLIASSSCKKSTESDLSIFKRDISKTWKLTTALRDGVDITNYYPGLSLTINQNEIISTNGVAPLWKPLISYTIAGDKKPFVILRADGIDMTVVDVNSKLLTLEFKYDAVAAGGRSSSISGQYHMEFQIQ